MKQILWISCAALLATACNTETKEAETTATTETAAAIEYPYTPATPYRNWQIGSEENTVVAMKALKGWETKDFAALEAALSDSLSITMDGFKAKMSRDSAVQFLKAGRENFQEYAITMQDWESVISADKEHEYVTLWYTEVWTDKKGVKDSLNIVDDVKLKNGKMIEIDGKIQHFPKAK